ncbi:hypothetical protein [Rhodohalobacter sp.]|uniref:hypothetical protein n=1 Tax=Rhodohalobacter sp. TaxID=1974210 RepID=UPI002ACE003D|nr:hypothetical protein [Rhodohalobacter sp.]MDZ7756298.1 hypothetical protein [Rhodohalobacter sp.]
MVRSQREEEEQKNIGRVQVNTELIKELPSVFEADVFRSIQQLPGVKAASDFSSGLYIRGGSPDQTLILLDEPRVQFQPLFWSSSSHLQSRWPLKTYDYTKAAASGNDNTAVRSGSALTIFNADGNRRMK